ncbi:MAG: Si-specific NAD(P)(+) transhydrogenase [Candidatus Rokubacteria bacterium]|nr:Si-specific NAD(P)(+) transhydrogenase [Candidatus Rokubacteria bacterium]
MRNGDTVGPRYDLIVIGSGPAGHHAAIQAAKLGNRVAIVERRMEVGGVCLNTGTIPSKTLREAVLYLSGYRQRGLYGQAYRTKQTITMQDLMFRCEHVIRKENDVYRAQFARNGVDLLEGEASFMDPHAIRIEEGETSQVFRAERFVIATGTAPHVPSNVPVDGARIIDSDGIFGLATVPSSLIVVGGGVIGMEYACMFATLGVPVTLIDGRRQLLDFVDSEIIEALTYRMREIGVTFRLGESMDRVDRSPDGRIVAHLKSNKTVIADVLLCAAGRVGNTACLNLPAAGLSADERGRLGVDDNFCTPVPHIYAAGDVVGFPSLASTSMEQGRVASAHAFGVPAVSVPSLFPYGIYTIPEISFVGRTEEQLTAAGVPYEVGLAHYREIARGGIIGDTTGRLKLIFHRESGALLGVHIIGEGATELVHIGQAVIALGGTLRYFVDHVFNYPTLAECYKVAALAGLNKLGARKTSEMPQSLSLAASAS